MNFEESKKLFQDELDNITKKYNVALYAANVVMKNGEVIPMIKIIPTKEDKLMETNEDTTKKQFASNSEA